MGGHADFAFSVSARPRTFDLGGHTWTYDEAETYKGVKSQHSSGWPMEFTPLSVPRHQAESAARMYPEREYTSSGACIARSKQHLERMAKAADLVDLSKPRVRSSTAKKVTV